MVKEVSAVDIHSYVHGRWMDLHWEMSSRIFPYWLDERGQGFSQVRSALSCID